MVLTYLYKKGWGVIQSEPTARRLVDHVNAIGHHRQVSGMKKVLELAALPRDVTLEEMRVELDKVYTEATRVPMWDGSTLAEAFQDLARELHKNESVWADEAAEVVAEWKGIERLRYLKPKMGTYHLGVHTIDDKEMRFLDWKELQAITKWVVRSSAYFHHLSKSWAIRDVAEALSSYPYIGPLDEATVREDAQIFMMLAIMLEGSNREGVLMMTRLHYMGVELDTDVLDYMYDDLVRSDGHPLILEKNLNQSIPPMPFKKDPFLKS